MHHDANAARERDGDGGLIDGSLRRPVGTALHTLSAASGSAVDGQRHVVRLDSVY